MNFVILSTVFLENAFVGPKHVFSERRMFHALLLKPATATFPVFLRRLVGASEELVVDRAEISAFFRQWHKSLLEKHITRRIGVFGCSIKISRKFYKIMSEDKI